MKGVSPSYTANYCRLAELQTKQNKTNKNLNLINHGIPSHSAQLSYVGSSRQISSGSRGVSEVSIETPFHNTNCF